ncbi:MAG: glycosyltransferase [Bacteroidetes bacterium]|nr:glycosyltransferase [Bacteroidota bacterium]
MNCFSIIIPVYNSAPFLAETVQEVTTSIEKINPLYELILINDGSTDDSWNVIKELKSKNKQITGVNFNKNYGQHNALLCGINLCNSDYIITLDDDLEQNPKDITTLYKKITEGGFDLVYGMPKKSTKNIFRKITRFVYKTVSRNEYKKAGEGSSFRIFTNDLKNKLVKHQGSLFFMDEIALWHSDNITFVPVHFNPSKRKKSTYGYGSLFTLSLRVLSLSSTMPLRLVRVFGFYISGFSVALGIYFAVRKFFNNVPMGYTSLMVTILFSTGIVMASLGIIGEYLGNLIALSNNKPAYSIKEKI